MKFEIAIICLSDTEMLLQIGIGISVDVFLFSCVVEFTNTIFT